MSEYPVTRPRRMRASPKLRAFARESRITPEQLIWPMFVSEGATQAIASMPGISRYSLDDLRREVATLPELGLLGVILFGIPNHKDETGSEAHADTGILAKAIRAVKAEVGERLLVVADVCLCEYTSHGHCGVLRDGRVDNDATLPILAKTAVCYAQAGADIVAPSDMMDGRVGAIREALDDEGLIETPILAYSAKYCSAFYGPFRDAADSAPQFGDRRGYQMDPSNRREALREVELDIAEGADAVMVKPALPYLDIIREVRDAFDVPIAAYNVSGEYSMLKAAAANGWIDEDRAIAETLTCIKRAGADVLVTYHAKEFAEKRLHERD